MVAVLLVTAWLFGPSCYSQDSPLPPTITPLTQEVPPGPAPLKMVPLNQLPGQVIANQNQARAGGQVGAAGSVFTPQASTSRSAVGQRAFSPNMIGDGFGPAPFSFASFISPTVQTQSPPTSIGTGAPLKPPGTGNGTPLPPTIAPPNRELGTVTTPGGGGTVGTSKIAENTSPIPRDRVFLNYSDFNGVPLILNGVNVNRVTPGFEKTFFEGMSSIEVRTPFASTLSNDLYVLNSNDTQSTQFGNLTIYLKQLLYRSDDFAVSGGLGLALPTASNVNVFLNSNQQLLSIKNQSVHLLPFLGSVYSPSEQFFVQQFLQFDFDTNGDNVEARNATGGLSSIGRLRDMSYLYYSIGSGYWIYNNPDSDRLFTRIAPIAELHYNKSITSTDTLTSPLVNVGQSGLNQDLLNGTIGLTAMMGQNKTLTLGYVTPLSSIDHRQFNSEFRVIFNWFFGAPLNRLSRVQF